MTNLNKTKEEIIFELVLSLNQGDSGYITRSSGQTAAPRIELAMAQYDALVHNNIIWEVEE